MITVQELNILYFKGSHTCVVSFLQTHEMQIYIQQNQFCVFNFDIE